MATLNENLKSFAAALGNDYKALKSSISATDNKIGTLAGLETTNKGDIVTAMNELKESIVDVQGKAITEEAVDVKLSAKQDKLTPGSGITLTGNTISASVDLSALATIASVDDKIKVAVDKLVNGAYWREWSDGWLEEGGYCPISGTPSIVTVSYHKPFKNPPIMTLTDVTKQDTTGGADVYKTPTTTNFSVILVRNNRQGFYWKAEGYKA